MRPLEVIATPSASAVPAEPSPTDGRATAHTSSNSASNKFTPASSIGEEIQPYYCNKCFQIMDSALMTAAHTRATGHKDFTDLIAEVACPNCPQKFKTVAGLEKHRSDVHSGPASGMSKAQHGQSAVSSTSIPTASMGEEQSYFCNDCYQIINSGLKTAAHTSQTGHSRFNPLIAEVACPDCTQKFKTVAGLEKHRSQAHSRPVSIMLKSVTVYSEANEEVQAAATTSPTEDTQCAKCTVGFISTEALQAHYAESPLHPTCHTCGLGFASIGPWATHKARCPPPGSTKATNGAMSDRDPAAPSRKGKEVERDILAPTGPEGSGPDSDRDIQRSVHVTAEGSGGISLATSAKLSAVATRSVVPDTLETLSLPRASGRFLSNLCLQTKRTRRTTLFDRGNAPNRTH
ncbi:hypothetical protein OH76DRAFT_1419881 [Lentinus brumalis]|uniref:C2H2-type domain-containing protein n=1 Tax=Lentinus brumalis TaxID=2498619 RepID=A0A371D396_9APHY|nr:hypothetical protein OH76DRAFT_1419881 [Polyporus brumalis]